MTLLPLLASRARANHQALATWATWDPASLSADGVLSDGNMQFAGVATQSGDYIRVAASATLVGKVYWEVEITGLDGDFFGAAIGPRPTLPMTFSPAQIGDNTEGVSVFYRSPAQLVCQYNNSTAPYGYFDPVNLPWPTGRLGMMIDMASRKVWIKWIWATGETYIGGGDPVDGTSPTYTLTGTDDLYAMATGNANNDPPHTVLISDPDDFMGVVPAGFTAGLHA